MPFNVVCQRGFDSASAGLSKPWPIIISSGFPLPSGQAAQITYPLLIACFIGWHCYSVAALLSISPFTRSTNASAFTDPSRLLLPADAHVDFAGLRFLVADDQLERHLLHGVLADFGVHLFVARVDMHAHAGSLQLVADFIGVGVVLLANRDDDHLHR